MRIELKGAGYTYLLGSAAARKALKGVDLALESGELVGVIGPTGSGKSTLVQLLNGLILPTEGEVLADGLPLGSPRVRLADVRRQVGVLFQFPETQLFEETVERDVAYGARNTGCPQEELAGRVRWALDQVGLSFEEYAHRSPFDLSGGEMRRVAIAGVLAMRPEILVLDEPTSGLDPTGRAQLLSRLEDLNRREGLGVVLVSHNLEEVARVCGRVVILNEGEVTFDGPIAKAFLDERELSRAGMELPSPARLLAGLRSLGWDLPAGGISVEDCVEAVARSLKARGVALGAAR